jgi:multidrug efflux pump subunit AcrA (membrane-fusion protein)
MKRLFLILIALVLGIAGAIYFFPRSGHPSSATGSKQLYTCGMHPQIVRDKPGDCPICGMKLTPLRSDIVASKSGAEATAAATGDRKIKYYKSTMMLGEISQTPRKDSMGMDMVPVYEGESDSGAISIDPVTTQNMGLRTGVVTKGPLRHNIRTVGVVDFDETALSDVTTKFQGWVEKLHIDATGKQVHKGEPLFEIYSPDLYTAQNDYLLALKSGSGLKESAQTKLKYFDVSPEQITELEKSGKVKKTLMVNAPRDGIVVEKMVVEGQMVEAGMKLYRVADLGTVWVQSQVYEQDLAFLKLGQEATVSLSYLPDREFRGRVTYIYPTVDEKTRTAKVRMEFHNPGFFLKPGMFATVRIASELEPEALLVPDMAVLRSGEKNTVFVALEGGKFEPRTVTIGARSDGNAYQVLSGLQDGDRVVTSGQFMLDSESQLREAIQKMLKPEDARTAEQAARPGPPAEEEKKPAAVGLISFICPMPEHLAIKYDHPGKCPICGMGLVPVSSDVLARLQPDGKVDHYTCPMPEHSDVRASKPGKCPRCGMTLIPVMTAVARPADAPAPAPPAEHLH